MKNVEKPIIMGAVHLPYYGRNNPAQSISQLEEYVMTNVKVHYENGFDMVYIQDENLNTREAYPETIALMAALGKMVKNEFPDKELGMILQAVDGVATMAAATMGGYDFARIKVFAGTIYKAEGIRQGVGIDAVNMRTQLNSKVKIFADVHDREGIPMPNVPIGMAIDWSSHIGADGIILTGHDHKETLEYLVAADEMDLEKPIIVGGSVNEENIYEILEHSDGAVVSSSLMLDEDIPGSLLRWDAEKIKRFMDKVDQCIKQ
ncbi:MAG: hypothetical protein HFG92_15090 [Dorea sp.]|jgi:predicted TIM-barrel enzyme|nr:hypothetical protein [Dorea sp.]